MMGNCLAWILLSSTHRTVYYMAHRLYMLLLLTGALLYFFFGGAKIAVFYMLCTDELPLVGFTEY